jgi:hypothetical protein
MIVHNLDFMGAILTPDEDGAPLAVDPDRMLAGPVASQCLQAIAGGTRKSSNRSAALIAASFRRATMASSRAMPRGCSPDQMRAVALSAKLRITAIRIP